ncbi:NADPH-dependent FMN reductase [Priestia filamentosa]|uniref:NADPH-dependent FMN reductase n=1 Tax=Priestia filamentosa TaxID=1402861 RepID=UPI0039827D73
MKIVVINGTPRESGRTRILSRFLAEKYSLDLIDLSETVLPVFNGTSEQYELENVVKVKELVHSADAIILTTPEYHGSMSGALKNMFDFLTFEQFKGKPVGLLAVAGGGKGGINALNSMRDVMRALYANALPKQIVFDPPMFEKDSDLLVPEASEALEGFMEELKKYTKLYKEFAKA